MLLKRKHLVKILYCFGDFIATINTLIKFKILKGKHVIQENLSLNVTCFLIIGKQRSCHGLHHIHIVVATVIQLLQGRIGFLCQLLCHRCFQKLPDFTEASFILFKNLSYFTGTLQKNLLPFQKRFLLHDGLVQFPAKLAVFHIQFHKFRNRSHLLSTPYFSSLASSR